MNNLKIYFFGINFYKKDNNNYENFLKLKRKETNMNRKEKITAFLKQKGFYIVAVLCLMAVGIAGFGAYSNSGKNLKIEQTPSKTEIIEQTESEPSETEDFTSPDSETPAETEQPAPVTEKTEPQTEQTGVTSSKFILPVHGDIIAKPNLDELTFSPVFGDYRLHLGTDIGCDEGTPVNSATSGKIESIEQDAFWGTVITVDHQNGLIAKYMSVNPGKNIKQGMSVSSDTVLGKTAKIPAESNLDPHFHIEIYQDGKPISPLKLFGLE